jgi:hypothetical protein
MQKTANGNASRLVHGENVRYVSISFCLAPIDVSDRLAASIFDFVAAEVPHRGALSRAGRTRDAAVALVFSTDPTE